MRQRRQPDAEEEKWIEWTEERAVGIARKPDRSPEGQECSAPQPAPGFRGGDERPHALHAPAQPYHRQRYGKKLYCRRRSPQHWTPRQRLTSDQGDDRQKDAPAE